GQNFLTESNGQSLHPDLKLGDLIEIEFLDGTKIEREVVGFIESQKDTSIENSGNLNGVFISEKDYSEINRSTGVYLSYAYALRLKDKSNAETFVHNLQDSLKEKFISQVSLTRSSLT